MAEGDLGAGSSSSSSSSSLSPPEHLLSKMSDGHTNTNIGSPSASRDDGSNNSNSNGLWGSILERSRTAPLPDEYAFDGGGAWGGGGGSHASNNTGNNSSNNGNNNPAGPDHAGGSSPPRGSGHAGGGGGGGGGAVGGSGPGLGFIDEYGGPSGANNNAGVGSGHQTMGRALTSTSTSPSSRTTSGGSRLPPGLSAAESTDSATGQQQQFLFEAAGGGLRRPASTGIMLEQPTTVGAGAAAAQAQAHGHGGSHGSSLVMASAEVLKSLGLEIPGYTGSAAGSGAGNDGGEATNAATTQVDTTSASAADDNAAAAAQQLPRSGSALMTLIQEEMRSGRASAATPAMERSASAAPAEPSVDEIGAGLQGLQVAQKQEPTAQGQSQSTSSRPTQYSQYHPSPHRNSQQHQQQYQYPNQQQQQQQQQQQYEQLPHQHQQAAIYHQPSPVFTGMSPHNSPPEMFLGQHGAPVSPHGHVQHQMYGHLPPSAVAYGQAGIAPQQQHQPPPAQHSQAQTQPPQPQTMYYTQGPNGQMQAVYVNTAAAAPQPYGHIPPPPPAAMPHGYGYATIQYHPGPPPPSQQGGGGHHHQHHPQQQARPQVLHIDANGQPIAATAPAAPTTAYAYYPGTGQYAPDSTAANSHGGQPVVIANAGGAPPSMGYQYSGGGNGGGGGGGSPRHGRSNHHHHQGGMGGSGHGGRSSRYGGGGRSNNSGGGGGYNSNRGGVDGSGTNHPSSHRHRSNTGSSATNSGPTNPMLEEFRHNKSSASTWTVSDIRGHVVDFCRDQNGSRFIQQRLEVAPPAEKDLVMEELLAASGGDGLAALCGDVFGNYVVQKLLEVGDAKILGSIYEGALVGHMMELSMQMYGCRVVQRSFERLPSKHFPALLQEFKDNKVVACIHDSNGNHVSYW